MRLLFADQARLWAASRGRVCKSFGHAFVPAAGRVVPNMRDRQLGDDERDIVHENVARVRAA
ncbi:DUF6192 family protein [Streptomyces malaysiensis]|nr:DUF6192 family protein [Streptomyces malaysiensis]